MENVVKLLTEKNKTISFMESCTGGGVSNSVTNVSGASEVLKFSAVTYSNEFKIKMGVSSEIIDKYSVYSIETAMSMAESISNFSLSNYGVGITGKLNKIDKNNLYGDDDMVYISIYDRDNEKFFNNTFRVKKDTREENKSDIIDFIKEKLLEILR